MAQFVHFEVVDGQIQREAFMAKTQRRSHPTKFKIDDLGFWIARSDS